MRRVAWSAGAVFLCLGLASGCVQEPAPTVEYFRAHPEARAAQLGRCMSDPGALKGSAGCVNSREAERQESVGSMRKLPPLGLPEKAPDVSTPDEETSAH